MFLHTETQGHLLKAEIFIAAETAVFVVLCGRNYVKLQSDSCLIKQQVACGYVLAPLRHLILVVWPSA